MIRWELKVWELIGWEFIWVGIDLGEELIEWELCAGGNCEYTDKNYGNVRRLELSVSCPYQQQLAFLLKTTLLPESRTLLACKLWLVLSTCIDSSSSDVMFSFFLQKKFASSNISYWNTWLFTLSMVTNASISCSVAVLFKYIKSFKHLLKFSVTALSKLILKSAFINSFLIVS